MATAVQRYLYNLFNLETNKSRNDKLLNLNLKDMGRIHTHISNSNRWIKCRLKGQRQSFYNPELDVKFLVTYSAGLDREYSPIIFVTSITTKRDVNNNGVFDLLAYGWDESI